MLAMAKTARARGRLVLVGLGLGGAAGAAGEALDALVVASRVFAPRSAAATLRELGVAYQPFSPEAVLAAAEQPGLTVAAFPGHPLFCQPGAAALLAARPDAGVVAGLSPQGWAVGRLAIRVKSNEGLLALPFARLAPGTDPRSYVFAFAQPCAAESAREAAAKAAAVWGEGSEAAWLDLGPDGDPRLTRSTLRELRSHEARPGDWGVLVLPTRDGPGFGPAAPGDDAPLWIVGLGMPQIRNATNEARAVVRRSKTVFTMDPKLPFFRELPGKALPVGTLYGADGQYDPAELHGKALAAAKKGTTAVCIYGHATIYEPFCSELVELAAARKVACRVAPGVSTADAAQAALKLVVGPDAGLQVTTRYHVAQAALDARSHLVAFKVFDEKGSLPATLEALRRAHPAGKQAALLRCANWDEADCERVTLGKLPSAVTKSEVFRTLVVPA